MSGNVVEDQAFVSLVTNNGYANGALVLGYSLRRVNTTRKLVLLVAKEVPEQTRQELARVWDHLEIVDLLDSNDAAHLALLTRPELGITFTKIHCWSLTQYRKCVFLDADTLIVQNCDELFERNELSAVPDIGWPDCFNSGVFVFEPSTATHEALLQFAVEHGSFDGGDQGLLNSFFRDWRTSDISRHLSFVYNMNSNASYTYAPAYQQFGRDVRIVHFIGPLKPWHYTYNPATGNVYIPSMGRGMVPHEALYLNLWWDIFLTFVQPGMRQCHEDRRDDSSHSPSEHYQPAPCVSSPQCSHPAPYHPSAEHFQPPPPPPQYHYQPPPPQYHYQPPPSLPPPPPPSYCPPPPPPPQNPPCFYPTPYIPPPQHFEQPPPPPQHFEPPPPPPPAQHLQESAPPTPPEHCEPSSHAPDNNSSTAPEQGLEQYKEVEKGHSESVNQQEAPEFNDVQSSSDVQDLSEGISSLHLPDTTTELDPVAKDLAHRRAWENGQIDYLGKDRFYNILSRIEEFIGAPRPYTDVPLFLF